MKYIVTIGDKPIINLKTMNVKWFKNKTNAQAFLNKYERWWEKEHQGVAKIEPISDEEYRELNKELKEVWEVSELQAFLKSKQIKTTIDISSNIFTKELGRRQVFNLMLEGIKDKVDYEFTELPDEYKTQTFGSLYVLNERDVRELLEMVEGECG